MNNVLIFSDLHISQSSAKECISILEELTSLAIKHNVDTIINLGDTFDGIKPSSSEMDIFASFIRTLGNRVNHIILAANSHESESEEKSILNHYGILSNNVKVVKEFINGNHLYCGHFSITEDNKNYDAKLSKEDLKQYLYVFLGHIHSYSLIKPNIVHLGSSRYVNFDESVDKNKIIALITDYDNENEKVHFLKLKSPIPMTQIELGKTFPKYTPKEAPGTPKITKNKEPDKASLDPKSTVPQAQPFEINPKFNDISQLSEFLDKTAPKTKIKVKIHDFESFQQFLQIVKKYESKFEIFRYETEFTVIPEQTKDQKNQSLDFQESLIKYLELNKIPEEIRKILLENK